jgi:hypothetical protein
MITLGDVDNKTFATIVYSLHTRHKAHIFNDVLICSYVWCSYYHIRIYYVLLYMCTRHNIRVASNNSCAIEILIIQDNGCVFTGSEKTLRYDKRPAEDGEYMFHTAFRSVGFQCARVFLSVALIQVKLSPRVQHGCWTDISDVLWSVEICVLCIQSKKTEFSKWNRIYYCIYVFTRVHRIFRNI